MAPPPHQSTAPANGSSATQTQHDLPATAMPGVLRLRAEPPSAGSRRIHWAEDVIDNEGMGKKKSKVCCIYHKAREVGESSSESEEDDSSSSSSSDGGSDSGNDDGRAKMGKGKGDGDGDGDGEQGRRQRRRTRGGNAYEKEHGHGHGHGHRRSGEKGG